MKGVVFRLVRAVVDAAVRRPLPCEHVDDLWLRKFPGVDQTAVPPNPSAVFASIHDRHEAMLALLLEVPATAGTAQLGTDFPTLLKRVGAVHDNLAAGVGVGWLLGRRSEASLQFRLRTGDMRGVCSGNLGRKAGSAAQQKHR